VPADADSGRGLRLRQILRSRAFTYVIVLGSAAAIVIGASLGSMAVMFGGPVAFIATALALAFATADWCSERDFFRAYAAPRGLVYEGTFELAPLTPLLGAGDWRRCIHWMREPLGSDGLGHFMYKVRDRERRFKRPDTRKFTVCTRDLEAAISMFPAVFLCRRRGVFEKLRGEDWLSHTNRHQVELESERLCERYELWVEDGQDELLLRELFAPSFEVLLAEHPLQPCFEYRAGTLVVYVERRLTDEGHLDWLREVAAKIGDRFTTEVGEASRA
jgi:hypothetical protein